MKSFQILLIIGAALLVAGLAVASVSVYSVTKQFLQGAVMIDVSLEPGSTQAFVMQNVPAGQQILLSISGAGADKPLQVILTGPDGSRLAAYNVTGTPFVSQTQTRISGNETLTIRNTGPAITAVKGTLATLPIGQQGSNYIQNNPQLQSVVTYGLGILAGIVLIVAGIVVLIAGFIKFLTGRKKLDDSKISG